MVEEKRLFDGLMLCNSIDQNLAPELNFHNLLFFQLRSCHQINIVYMVDDMVKFSKIEATWPSG